MEVLRFDEGRLEIDTVKHAVLRDGEPVDLTPNEYKLLLALASYPGRAYSRFELVNRVQGYDFEGYERTIDVHVKNLRKKIEPDPSQAALRRDGDRRRLPAGQAVSEGRRCAGGLRGRALGGRVRRRGAAGHGRDDHLLERQPRRRTSRPRPRTRLHNSAATSATWPRSCPATARWTRQGIETLHHLAQIDFLAVDLYDAERQARVLASAVGAGAGGRGGDGAGHGG